MERAGWSIAYYEDKLWKAAFTPFGIDQQAFSQPKTRNAAFYKG